MLAGSKAMASPSGKAAPAAEAGSAAAAPAATEVLSYGGDGSDQQIFLIVRGYPRAGHLKIAASGMAFKEKKSGKKTQISKQDIVSLRWMRVGRGHQLQIGLKGGTEICFDGFRNTQKDAMLEFFDRAFPNIVPETEDVSTVGWNWGDYKATGSALQFLVNDKIAFEVPFSAIEKAQSASKHETSIEFALDQEDKAMQFVESMRFHFTQHPDDFERDVSRPEELKDLIMRRVDTAESGGQAISAFKEVMCMNPRGKYDFDFFPQHVTLHGKSADFKIPYDTIKRLFLLTTPDQPKKFLVFTLDPPIRHNLKKHHILPFQFEQGVEIEASIAKPDVDDVPERLAELAETETGEECEIVARLLKLLSKAKLLSAGSFRSENGNEAVKASVKNVHDGYLYPLEKAFLFIFKFPTYIRYDEVAAVSFERIKASESLNRSFDLEVTRKDGESVKFTSIPKEELGRLREFLTNKRLNITSVEDDMEGLEDILGEDEDEDDDAYMRQVKSEGRGKGGEGGAYDSEEDEDFRMSDQEESSVDEEYADSGDSDAGGAAASRPKKRKKRAASDAGSGDDDADDDDDAEDGGTPKKAKKVKRKKDPNAPKKPQSSFMIYSNEVRDSVKEANPEASFGDIGKLIGAQWKELPDEDKVPYEEKAKEAKAQYKIDLAKYYEEHPEAKEMYASPTKAAKAAKKKKLGPKKPQSSYTYFMAAKREDFKEANPDASFAELSKLIAEQWKELEDKSEYEDLAAKDKERFVREKEEWRQARIAAGEEVDKPEKKGRRGKYKDPNTPKKPQSSFMIYSNEVRDSVKEANPEASFGDIGKLIGAKWQEMKDEDKAPYEEKAKEAKEQYKIDLAKYYEEHPEAKAAAAASRAAKKPKSSSGGQIKGQSKLSFKSADVLGSSDDVDSDDQEAIEDMLSKVVHDADEDGDEDGDDGDDE